MEPKDISAEKWRKYHVPVVKDGRMHVVVVEFKYPVKLYVAPSGSHRIITKDGLGHYVPAGFIHIEWDGPVLF